MIVELQSDVVRRSTLLVAEPLVLGDEEPDPGETGGSGSGDPLVEVTETGPAEM